LKQWIAEIGESFAEAGTSSHLLMDMDAFNGSMYTIATNVMGITLTIAYVILALFFVLELLKVSVKVEGAGGGSTFGAEMVFKVMFKMVLCKLAVDSSLLFMGAIYEVGQTIIRGIGSLDGVTAVDLSASAMLIDNMSLGAQIGMLLELIIIKFGVWITLSLVQIICIGRFIEIYVHVAISPIPIATFPSEELSSIAKNFFKSFAAVCLQGVFIYIILAFFPSLFLENLFGALNGFSLFLYSIVLVMAIFASGRWARSICNVM